MTDYYDYQNDATAHDNSSSSSLSDPQEIVLSCLPLISGTLSILGSSLIIIMVLRTTRKHTPYHRILLGLSATDIIAAISYMLQPFLLPSDTSHRVWASGTDVTCSLLGFLYQFSFSTLWYNGFLSCYYLLTVRCGVTQSNFEKRYEIWGHVVCLGFSIITATIGWALDMYSEFVVSQGCWISDYPKGCDEDDSVTCIGSYIAWAFGGIPNCLMWIVVVINNIIIFQYVHSTTMKVSKYGGTGTGCSPQQQRKIRAVAQQALFYVGTFALSYIWTLIVRTYGSLNFEADNLESDLYPFLVLQAFFHPIQGFFNCFVYSRPNYLRIRQQCPQESCWWALKRVWFGSKKPAAGKRTLQHTNTSSSKKSSTAPSGNTEWFVASRHDSRHNSSSPSSGISSEIGAWSIRGNERNSNVPPNDIVEGAYSCSSERGPEQKLEDEETPRSKEDGYSVARYASSSRMSSLGNISEDDEDEDSFVADGDDDEFCDDGDDGDDEFFIPPPQKKPTERRSLPAQRFSFFGSFRRSASLAQQGKRKSAPEITTTTKAGIIPKEEQPQVSSEPQPPATSTTIMMKKAVSERTPTNQTTTTTLTNNPEQWRKFVSCSHLQTKTPRQDYDDEVSL